MTSLDRRHVNRRKTLPSCWKKYKQCRCRSSNGWDQFDSVVDRVVDQVTKLHHTKTLQNRWVMRSMSWRNPLTSRGGRDVRPKSHPSPPPIWGCTKARRGTSRKTLPEKNRELLPKDTKSSPEPEKPQWIWSKLHVVCLDFYTSLEVLKWCQLKIPKTRRLNTTPNHLSHLTAAFFPRKSLKKPLWEMEIPCMSSYRRPSEVVGFL